MRLVSEETTSKRLANGRRVKHVSAREVSADEERSLRDHAARPATTVPAVAMHTVVVPPEQQSAVDPTAYLERRRKRSHEIEYRATQILTGAGFVLGVLGLLLSIWANEAATGMILSIIGLGAGAAALVLSDRTQLASRMKGYAVARWG